MNLNKWLKTEEFFLFLFSIYLFTRLDYAWWLFPVFFLVPDLGMAGYAVNNRVGAVIYNIVHHKGLALTLWIIGALGSLLWLQFAGIILLAHTSLDRVFGYGLKYPDHFKHTHLGKLK